MNKTQIMSNQNERLVKTADLSLKLKGKDFSRELKTKINVNQWSTILDILKKCPSHIHIASNKGYTLLHQAKNEADGSEMVVYQGEDGQIWVRPAKEFAEKFKYRF